MAGETRGIDDPGAAPPTSADAVIAADRVPIGPGRRRKHGQLHANSVGEYAASPTA